MSFQANNWFFLFFLTERRLKKRQNTEKDRQLWKASENRLKCLQCNLAMATLNLIVLEWACLQFVSLLIFQPLWEYELEKADRDIFFILFNLMCS